jgi:hypothetical protein
MKTTVRTKLLLVGAILIAAALWPAPALAFCTAEPEQGFYSVEQCQNYCRSGGCFSYRYDPDGEACFCR